jgi:hypothetical protein
MSARRLKQTLRSLLEQTDFDESLEIIRRVPPRQVISPLLSFFFATEDIVKWRAVTAVGAVVYDLANQEMEAARIIMRRLMWSLNDESGGIGWGSPEAMGEIMSRHQQLADEFSRILVSYIDREGNFIEHEMLQRGVLWGIGRLAHVRPELLRDAIPLLPPYLQSEDPMLRGIAAWAAGTLPSELTKPLLQKLTSDETSIKIFIDGRLLERTITQLAEDALSFHRLKKHSKDLTVSKQLLNTR